ncbi:MAG: hypothetical protein ACKV19_19805 [Verrucomicrobiales bacterium]
MKADPLNRGLEEARYRLTREIRENPLLCVGLALGVGAVIGALGSRAAASKHGPSHWLADLASTLGSEAHKLGHEATRAGRHAGKELQAALHQASDAVPDVELEQLIRRGRRWLRSVLG